MNPSTSSPEPRDVVSKIIAALDAACGDYPAPGSAEALRDSTNVGVAGYWAMHRAADIAQRIAEEHEKQVAKEALQRPPGGVTALPLPMGLGWQCGGCGTWFPISTVAHHCPRTTVSNGSAL